MNLNRIDLESHPDRINRHQIRAGDLIERWSPVMVPAPDGWRFQPDPSGEMTRSGPRFAHRQDYDLAGRWTDPTGELVHGAHDGSDSGREILIRHRCPVVVVPTGDDYCGAGIVLPATAATRDEAVSAAVIAGYRFIAPGIGGAVECLMDDDGAAQWVVTVADQGRV